MQTRKTSRRSMLTTTLPAVALASAAGVTHAIASTRPTRPRPAAEIPVRRREFWDPIADWVCGYEDVVCCTPAERAALLTARPEMAAWLWLDFGDHVVGTSPRQKPDHLKGDIFEVAKRFCARVDEVRGPPPAAPGQRLIQPCPPPRRERPGPTTGAARPIRFRPAGEGIRG